MSTTQAPPAATSPQETAKLLRAELEMRDTPLAVGKFGLAVYGWSGAGKTFLGAGSRRRGLQCLVEPSEETFREFANAEGHYPFDIIDNANEARVRKALDLICKMEEAGERRWELFKIDSMTELMKVEMDDLLQERNLTIPDVDEYVEVQTRVRTLLRDLRKHCPIPYIVTFGVTREKNEKTGSYDHKPGAIGKLAGEVGHYFDAVGVIYPGERLVEDKGATPATVADVQESVPGETRRPRFLQFEGLPDWDTKARGNTFNEIERVADGAEFDALLDRFLIQPEEVK